MLHFTNGTLVKDVKNLLPPILPNLDSPITRAGGVDAVVIVVVVDPVDGHVMPLDGAHVVTVVLEGAGVDHTVFCAHHEDLCLFRVETNAAAATWAKLWIIYYRDYLYFKA